MSNFLIFPAVLNLSRVSISHFPRQQFQDEILKIVSEPFLQQTMETFLIQGMKLRKVIKKPGRRRPISPDETIKVCLRSKTKFEAKKAISKQQTEFVIDVFHGCFNVGNKIERKELLIHLTWPWLRGSSKVAWGLGHKKELR